MELISTFSKRCGLSTSIEAEIMDLQVCLQLVWDQGINQTKIEFDSLIMFETLEFWPQKTSSPIPIEQPLLSQGHDKTLEATSDKQGLEPLPMISNSYTYMGVRCRGHVLKCLDHALLNHDWLTMFSSATVQH
ncbi:hypothetical protein ACH5RR_026103 [Cinchona calisaya]|uniref:RNase H type-1 domain-containing protein n=1 Tax=Cinchona calisaya TaxID=153742 RepID=A0ABD2Z3H6_9GENT